MLSIERFEGTLALCENEKGERITLSAEALPSGAREGDLLVHNEHGGWSLDREESSRRKKSLADRLTKMSATTRRDAVEQALRNAKEPLSASLLAERFRVSRQIIVGDIALLRASGAPVVATPRGYLLEDAQAGLGHVYTIACCHTTSSQLVEELYLVVDQGAAVLDVTVEHPVYGQLIGQLQIQSRYDADRFVEALAQSDAAPLSTLTGGIHLHTVRCMDAACYQRVCAALRQAGILVEG